MTGEITTIFCDIGNVLMGFDHGRIWQNLATASPYSAKEIRQRIQAHSLLHRHEIGDISSQQLYHQMQSLLQLPPSLSFEQFCRLWGEIFWPQNTMLGLADSLRQRYRMMLLSNTNEIHWSYLTSGFPFFTQVDDAVLSFQVHSMKPSPEIYTEALRRAAVPADHCVFIDDIAVNIQAACECGIYGIHYQSAEQTVRELRRLGVQREG
jgi:putative hydrolase of the HAD superfamily